MPAAFKMRDPGAARYRIKCKKPAEIKAWKPAPRTAAAVRSPAMPTNRPGSWRGAEWNRAQPLSGREVENEELPGAVGQQQIDDEAIRPGGHRLDP
jgi:hypothetical protein